MTVSVNSERSDWVKPRLASLPDFEYDNTTAIECLEFVESVGFYLDDWQKYLVELSLLERLDTPTPRWLMREFSYLVARQNGKGGVLTARSIIDLFFLNQDREKLGMDPALVVYTAHQFKTARESFLRLRQIIEGSTDLMKMMKPGRNHGVRTAVGEEGFELANGNRLRYLARSTGGSGRGYTIDTLLLDEAQELPETAMDALRPTQSALRNPQRVMTGTVPDETNHSEVWTAVRDKGRLGQSRSSGWAEWSPDPEDPGVAKELTRPVILAVGIDPKMDWARKTNPALGGRISEDAIADELESMKAKSYLRERLSWWPPSVRKSNILSNWGNLRDPHSQIVSDPVFAVEVSEDRNWTTILAAGARLDGLFHVEVVDYRPGTDWTVARLKELVVKWDPQVLLVDVGGPAGSLVSGMEQQGVAYRPLKVAEFGQSCEVFHDLVRDSQVRWLNHPALQLAIDHAKWRTLGQSKAWDRKIEQDAGPLNAGSMAVWGVLTGVGYPEQKAREKQISRQMYSFQ